MSAGHESALLYSILYFVGWLSKDGFSTNLVYFDQSIENEIYFDNVAWSGYLQGTGESESKGIEVDFEPGNNKALS